MTEDFKILMSKYLMRVYYNIIDKDICFFSVTYDILM